MKHEDKVKVAGELGLSEVEFFKKKNYYYYRDNGKLLKTLKSIHRENLEKIDSGEDFKSYLEICDRALQLSSKEHKENMELGTGRGLDDDSKDLIDVYSSHLNSLIKENRLFEKTQKQPKAKKNEEPENIYAVFLSHASIDKALANLIKKLLEDFNVSSFVAHDDIEEGDTWEPIIIDAVRSSLIMLVIGTKDIMTSAWVNFETGLGYEKMFAFMIDKLSDKVSYIKSKQNVIFSQSNVEGSILKLIYSILRKLGITTSLTEDEIKELPSYLNLKIYLQKNHSYK